MLNKNNRIVLGVLATLASSALYSQEVIATTGEYFSNSNASLSWTLGETMMETYTAGGSTLTQGQQQTNYDPILSFTVLNEIEVDVYPIPTTDRVKVTYKSEGLNYQLFDGRGSLVLSDQTSESSFYIDLINMEDGIYYIHFISPSKELIEIFKIIKL